MTKQKIILNERVWLKKSKAVITQAKKHFLIKNYDEQSCKQCEFKAERFCDVCSTCPAYGGETQMYRKRVVNGVTWYGFPKGNQRLLKPMLPTDYKVVDKRPSLKLRYKIRFTGKLHDTQKEPVDTWIKRGYGVLQAPPRSGKTVMGVYTTCKIGKKTIILASQRDWLVGFLDTFETMTDIRDVEKAEGKRLIGFAKSYEELISLDIALCTYQTFISVAGQKKLASVKNMFSVAIVDECHDTAATAFSRMLLSINVRHLFGLTGTPDRKDGAYHKVEQIIGPVTSRAKVETLKPRVEIVMTPASTKHNYKQWVAAMRFLCNHKERNELIIKHAVTDIKKGRSILIPVMFTDHAKVLVEGINAHFDKPVAAPFVGSTMNNKTRDKLIEDARSYKIKCVVGTRKIVQTGLNVPRWCTLFVIVPISNEPKFQQETSRIRTTMPGKQQPLIKFFVEDTPFSRGCFRTCWFQTIMKQKFEMTPETKNIGNKYSSRQQFNRNSFDLV